MPTAPLTITAVQYSDSEQTALVKLVYWLQTAAEALGVTGTTDMLKPSMAANANDGKQPLLVKAAYWAEQLAGAVSGGGGSAAVTPGAGAPPTDGSVTTLFYKNTTTGVIYINTGTVAVPTWDPT